MLDASEAVLSPLVEELLDGGVHTCLDVPVKVVEGQSQVLAQCVAHGGLTRPHVSDDDDSVQAFALLLAFGSGAFFTMFIHSS